MLNPSPNAVRAEAHKLTNSDARADRVLRWYCRSLRNGGRWNGDARTVAQVALAETMPGQFGYACGTCGAHDACGCEDY